MTSKTILYQVDLIPSDLSLFASSNLVSKVIRITKSGKFFLAESTIQGFGFRNLAQGSQNPTKMGIRNPCPTDKEIRNPQLGIQHPRLSWVTLHEATPSLTDSSN